MRISHRTPEGNEAYPHEIPQFGLGVFLMSEGGECKSSVLNALDAGYTHIDTARVYANESEVGQAIKESGVNRDSVFITTKLRRGHATGYEDTLEHCKKSLELLDMEYIDLYLVHAPPEDPEHRMPVWKAMEHCLEQGWVKAIGVSNYGAAHLEAMKDYASYMPCVNQVEFNPWLQRPQLKQAIEDAGAKVMAYSPLARGHKVDDPQLAEIAQRLGCTPAQVAIKFCYDQGCITIPKSSNPERIIENLASLEVDISEEMDAILALEENYVSGWDPTTEP
ncbi:MAG: aldo/keto reductase [Euryarchaeota archaeon]|nr:aldo/keto reductase [Euryarchaeota archaeon]|tara:strand:- start:11452 stop:12288 length:837 start_codon:yes stop_codon:yes gene_type:complete